MIHYINKSPHAFLCIISKLTGTDLSRQRPAYIIYITHNSEQEGGREREDEREKGVDV